MNAFYNNLIADVKVMNGKTQDTLRTVAKLIEAGEIRRKGNMLEMDNSVTFNTIYGKDATVTIATYPKQGSQSPSHCHDKITEYLICIKGSFSAAFGKGYRILKMGECLSISNNVLHTITALEDNSTIVAVCVPEENAYLESMKCPTTSQKKS